jgi:hypothetical protein
VPHAVHIKPTGETADIAYCDSRFVEWPPVRIWSASCTPPASGPAAARGLEIVEEERVNLVVLTRYISNVVTAGMRRPDGVRQ